MATTDTAILVAALAGLFEEFEPTMGGMWMVRCIETACRMDTARHASAGNYQREAWMGEAADALGKVIADNTLVIEQTEGR